MNALQAPYVGPRTFEKGDAKIFRGREKEARELVALVSSQRTVLFYAQSGAGKSSLINARLIPGLEKKGFEVLPIGRVGGESNPEEKTENIFIYNLLLTQDRGEIERSDEENKALQQRFAKIELSEFLNFLVFKNGNFQFDDNYQYPEDFRPKPRVLIIDQFEEVLTNHLNHENIRVQRQLFFEQIDKAMEQDPWLWVVFSIRDDYVAGLDPYAHLLVDGLRDRYYMERMEAEGALQAIKEPVRQFGWEYEPEAASELSRNLRYIQSAESAGNDGEMVLGDYVEPVQLQVVCYQLWQNLDKTREDKVITLADLENQALIAGGESVVEFVDSALRQFYTQAVKAVAEKEPGRTEEAVRTWFGEELVTPGNSRNLIIEDMGKVGSLDIDLVEKLDKTYRLVRPEVRGYSNWYELTHDRFIQPIQSANQLWLAEKPALYHAAREWDQGGRKEFFLFTGERLKQALETAGDSGLEESDMLVNDFVRASMRAESQQEDETRALQSYDRMISIGAFLLGAGILGYIPLIFLLVDYLKADEGEIDNFVIAFAVIIMVILAVIGGAIGWFVKRGGYDLMRSRSVRKKQLRIFQDKLERFQFQQRLLGVKGGSNAT